MGTAVNTVYAEKLQESIRVACKSLEEIKYDSLVIVVTEDGHTVIGSECGINFINSYDLVEEFCRYCYILRKVNEEHPSIPVKSFKKASPPRSPDLSTGAVSPEKWNALFPVTESTSMKEELDIFANDSFDEEGDSSDFEDYFTEDDKESSEATQGLLIPKKEIIILDQPPADEYAMKLSKRLSKRKASSAGSAVSKKAIKTEKKTPSQKSENGISKSRKKPADPNTPRRTFDCDQCDKKYLRFETLTYHKRSRHTGERPYTCRTCGKTFVSRTALRSHKDVHSDRTPYSCEECGQLFKRVDYLWRHKLTHSGEKRYICDVCERAFADSSTLKRHKMLHTDEWPECCEVCGRRFRTPKALREHMRVHTGEKPFTCETCGNQFRRKKNLNTHRRRRHDM